MNDWKNAAQSTRDPGNQAGIPSAAQQLRGTNQPDTESLGNLLMNLEQGIEEAHVRLQPILTAMAATQPESGSVAPNGSGVASLPYIASRSLSQLRQLNDKIARLAAALGV